MEPCMSSSTPGSEPLSITEKEIARVKDLLPTTLLWSAKRITGLRGGRGAVDNPVQFRDQSRQWPTIESGISSHHYLRYVFAASLASGRTLDAACGCGYGSSMLFRKTRDVTGVDYNLEAIDWATKYFDGPKYLHAKIEDSPWAGDFKTVVSLETIEHIQNPGPSLRVLRSACAGEFIASVPNEELYKFNAEHFKNDESPHFRHYTPAEFEQLLNDHHFRVTGKFCQKSKGEPEVIEGTDGKFLIYVCS